MASISLHDITTNLNNGDLLLPGRAPFPSGKHELYMKVCDTGNYRLLDHAGEDVGGTDPDDTDYVPGFFPGEHFGDYLILDIDDGKITNWQPKPHKVEAFLNK